MFVKTHLATILSLGLLTFSGCVTQRQNASVPTPALATKMIGTWVQVGTPGRVEEPPEYGGRFKHRTGTHWTIVSVNEKGFVTETFGGTYTMKGDQYVETQKHSDDKWIDDNGKSWRFAVKIDGDLMTQTGIGNPYNEVWRRVRPKKFSQFNSKLRLSPSGM